MNTLAATNHDETPPVAPAYVEQLENRLGEKHGERAHETNSLIAGLQKMLPPLLGGGSNGAARDVAEAKRRPRAGDCRRDWRTAAR
jgi:hypothetical protein